MRRLRKLVRLMKRREFRRGLRFGVGAAVEHEAVLRSIRPASIVDIGANVGQFTLLAVGLDPSVSVTAFEPLPEPANTFKRLFAETPNVRLYEVAIGEGNSRVTMHLSKREDSSSLLPIGRQQTQNFPGTHAVGTTEVEMSPLSRFMQPSDIGPRALLKLDVQGYELSALKACEPLLNRFTWIYAELSFVQLYVGQALAHDVFDFLALREFRLAGVYNLVRNAEGIAIQCDSLFARQM